jgi:protein tyrosine/serine phosphatase
MSTVGITTATSPASPKHRVGDNTATTTLTAQPPDIYGDGAKQAKALAPMPMGLRGSISNWLAPTDDIARSKNDVILGNFAKVDDKVYRGAMPTSLEAVEKLAKYHGITHIIDLRGSGKEGVDPHHLSWEKKAAKQHGMTYHHFNLSSKEAPPEHILSEISNILANLPEGSKAYIHCKQGIDRTGAVVGHYQKTVLKKPTEEIWRDMQKRGYNWYHRLTRFNQEKFIRGECLKDRYPRLYKFFASCGELLRKFKNCFKLRA